MMLVWQSTIDGIYTCTVERIKFDPYAGELIVKDAAGNELLREPVTLSYAAVFGPDAGDVADWQSRVMQFIDGKVVAVSTVSVGNDNEDVHG